MEIELVKCGDLKPGPWRSTYILKPDLKSLAASITRFGWTQPIVVRRETLEIIDGHERVGLFGSQSGKVVPAFMFEGDSVDSALLHLQLNRSRGMIVSKHLSRTVKTIIRSRKYTESHLLVDLAMSQDELDLLLDGTLLKQRNVASHNYSRAWVPIEAESGKYDDVVFERPPNGDQE